MPEVNANSFAPLAARDVDNHMLCHEPIMFDVISWKAPSTQRVWKQKRFDNLPFEKFSKWCDDETRMCYKKVFNSSPTT